MMGDRVTGAIANVSARAMPRDEFKGRPMGSVPDLALAPIDCDRNAPPAELAVESFERAGDWGCAMRVFGVRRYI